MPEATPLIKWKCSKCGHINITDDTLQYAEIDYIREDNIMCIKCDHDNHVVIADL